MSPAIDTLTRTQPRFHPDDRIRAKVEGHFESLKEAIVAAFGAERIASLCVTGAPGRGETTAELNGDRLTVYSDYDLLVLVDAVTEADRTTVRQLSREWSDRLRPEGVLLHVDIACLGVRELRGMAGTQAAWDIFHGSTLLRGVSPGHLLPDVAETPIGRDEALRLVVNRLGGSLELLYPELVIEGRGEREDLRLLESIYQSEKHVADAATAYLMTRGEYAGRYRERLELIRRRAATWSSLRDGEWLGENATRAIELKLSGEVSGWAAVAGERAGDLRTAAFEAWLRGRRALQTVLPAVLTHARGLASHDEDASGHLLHGEDVVSTLPRRSRWRARIGLWFLPLFSEIYRQRCIWGAIVETALALPEASPRFDGNWSTWQLERCASAHRLLDRSEAPGGPRASDESAWSRWLTLRQRTFHAWRQGGEE